MMFFSALLLTTFLSLNGQVVMAAEDSPEAIAYETETDTDIGDNTLNESTQSTVSGGDATIIVEQNNEEMISLLNEQIELMAENSSSTTGTLNSTVLDLMDRMIDDYPSYYKYAGFRTSDDDAYASTLYIAKKATLNGNTITFSDDCTAIHFRRNTTNNYSGYVYYTTEYSPNASVSVGSNSIVYTNVFDGYPTLGKKTRINEEYVWIGLFAVIAVILFARRGSNNA